MSTVTGYDDLTHGQTKALVSKMGGVEVAVAFLRGEYQLTPIGKAIEPLLTTAGSVPILATTEKFTASENFVVNIMEDAKVKISYLGENFVSWFLGKIEEPFAGSELRYQTLTLNSRDLPIIEELGGEEKAEVSLTEIFTLMEAQGKGEGCTLLNNGQANIFYVRGMNNVLCDVCVYWDDRGWGVNAGPIDDRRYWRDSSQVFSRNSVTM